MGSSLTRSDKVQPQQVDHFEYKKHEDQADITRKNRNTTDVFFLTLMATFFVALLVLVGYCMFNGDLYRILNGYDKCGNICGRDNKLDTKLKEPCKAENMKNKKYLYVTASAEKKSFVRNCVTNCSTYNYKEFLNRCIPPSAESSTASFFSKIGFQNFFQEVSEDLQRCWRELVYMFLIALGFSCLIMFLLRYFAGVVVWIVLVGVTLACIVGTTVLWILYHEAKNDSYPEKIDKRNTNNYLVFAILATVITVIVVLVVFVMRKRIQLVIRLFKEAGKALIAMPLLVLEPLFTFISLGVIMGIWFYFMLWIESSGKLTMKEEVTYRYQKDFVMKFTRWYNVVGLLWMIQFVIGCQHLVISGAVSIWYFTRNKSHLNSPIFKSAYNLTRYHLGSVALGSFLITVVQVIRMILAYMQKYLEDKKGTSCINFILKCCHCCFWCLEQILKFLTRNAYIEVAIHGYSFCKAGKQAFKHLANNSLRVAAINSVGDFVLLLAKVLVVISTVLVGLELIQRKEGIMHLWVPLTLAGLFAYFVSHCFITVYEMAIDTIFLCFCEDCEMNDGINKPYYMPKGLMEFVENSKKALDYMENNNRPKKGSRETPTISRSIESS